ncbi:MAG: phosphotransferase [Chloroflexi bacterium]|nr:phosphotransferase [Chloroflexota bacterium]
MIQKPAIPDSAAAITAEWMQMALRAGGASSVPVIRSVSVEVIGVGKGLVGTLARCRLTYDEGEHGGPTSVVVKLPGTDPKSRRMSKRLMLNRREFAFYSRIAPHAPIRTPALLYGDFDERSQRFVFVLEDLGAMTTVDQIEGLNAAQAMTAIRSLARLHGHFWNRPDQPPLVGCHDTLDPRLMPLAQLAYLAFLPPALDNFDHLFTARRRRLAEALATRMLDYIADVATGPRTFAHGDFRADNMFFGSGDQDDFAVVDWQVSGLSTGPADLAFFLGGSVSTELRRKIERDAVEEYHAIICGMGVQDFTFDNCWSLYRQSMLGHLIVSVFVCGGLNQDDQRGRLLVETITRRILTAIEDLDADEFLPSRPPTFSRANLVSTLVGGAFKAYRTITR